MLILGNRKTRVLFEQFRIKYYDLDKVDNILLLESRGVGVWPLGCDLFSKCVDKEMHEEESVDNSESYAYSKKICGIYAPLKSWYFSQKLRN